MKLAFAEKSGPLRCVVEPLDGDSATACLLAKRVRRHQLRHPMWAGFIGLVNPQNVKSTYSTGFHDITSGTSGSYSAVTGYDLVTGWGSPKAGLITTLAP